MAIDAQARSELLERDRELGVLEELIQGTLEGRRGLALIEGPAGIGKSRLLAATREAAEKAGFRVLAARGSDLERELPFGVVRQLFDPVLIDPDARARWMTGPAQPAAPRARARAVRARRWQSPSPNRPRDAKRGHPPRGRVAIR